MLASSDISPHLAALGGTHHGRLPEPPPRAADVRDDQPHRRGSIRLVLDRFDVRRIIDGHKTAHARLWRDTDPDDGLCQIGDRIPVQKRDAGVVLHVRIIDTDMRLLGEMDLAEARKHGYRTTRGYQRAWLRQHDRTWAALTAEQADDATDAEVDEAWSRHADRSVWVFYFAIDPLEALSYLAPASGRYGRSAEASSAARGYTASAQHSIDPDAPVVSGAAMATIQEAADKRHAALRKQLTDEQMAKRTSADDNLVERFVQTVAIARSKGIDPHSQIRLVGRALQQLEQAITERVAE